MRRLKFVIILIAILFSLEINAATVINRITKEFRASQDPHNYSTLQWIINPILPLCPQKYWKIVGEKVLEMNAAEKAAVDLANQQVIQNLINSQKDIVSLQKLVKAAILVLFDGYNSLRVKNGLPEVTLEQFKTDIINKYDTLQ